jgi:hypothetical protein
MIESIYVWVSTVLIIFSIAGVAWRGAIIISKKADIDKVVPRIEYEKDLKQINADFDNFAEDIEDINEWRKHHVELYHTIDKKLDLLVEKVTRIDDNCPKQTCKK